MSNEEQMRDALSGLLDRYVELVNSGDAGNWNPETEKEVIAARDALSNFASKQQEIDALRQQVLELSAQLEVMRKVLESCGARTFDEGLLAELRNALSIPPSAALLSHDNEVAAKALEEVLDKFAWFSSEDGLWLADAIQVIANERRNRK